MANINIRRIQNRLNTFADVSSLPEKDKERIYFILKEICKSMIEKRNNLVHSLTTKSKNNKLSLSGKIIILGYKYVQAALNWLIDKNLVQIKKLGGKASDIIATSQTSSALKVLDGLLNPPKIGPMKLVNNGGSVTFDIDGFDDIRKAEYLVETNMYNYIADIVDSFVDWPLKSSKISIEVNLNSSPILKLLSYMITIYRRYTKEHMFPLRHKISYELEKSNIEIASLKENKLWAIIWNFYKKDAEEEINKGNQLCLDKYLQHMIPDEETMKMMPDIVGGVTLTDYLKCSEVKNFISNVLSWNPNFFMPYFFWEKIGFTVVNPPEEGIVTPPLIHYYFAQNDFPYILVSLRRVLDEATWTLREEGIKFETEDARKQYQQLFKHEKIYRIYDQLHSWFHPSSWLPLIEVDRMKEFYQAWSVLRQKYINILIDISSILDAAYEQYIINNHKPTVDLVKVFSDLAHKIYSESEVLKMISEGKYLLPPEGTARPYNPL
ncbi:MAG: hypothetical protein QXZ02_07405 [Candidatus Bathyarchaeia archaeon]